MQFNATFLISAISFILFVIIMNLIFYKPIAKIVNERQKFIDENLDEAKKNNLESEKLIKQREKKLSEANFEGKSIIEKQSEEANINKTNLINQAQESASLNIVDNKNELTRVYAETKSNLKNEVSNLANEMTQKLFGEKVAFGNPDENEIEISMQEGLNQ